MARRHRKRQTRAPKSFRLQALQIYPNCQWCGCPLTRETATTDHLQPVSRGGDNDWGNLCLACLECNQERKNDLPQRLPQGPQWGKSKPAAVKPPCHDERTYAAWTRYAGGRWRSTLLGNSPDGLQQEVGKLFGNTVETVILPRGQEPTIPVPQNVFR